MIKLQGFSILLLSAALLAIAVPARTDVLYLTSGASVSAQILSFDGTRYRVTVEGQSYTYEASEVKGFAIDRRADPQPASDQIMQKLAAIESKIDQLSLNYQASSSDISQKLFNLNPVSQLRILSQRGSLDRNGTYTVTGQITNDSNDFVRNYRLRMTLFDTAGNAVATQNYAPLSGVIGPGERKNFKVDFSGAPANSDRVEIVPCVSNRPSDQDIGDYQQQNPAAPYRQ